MEWKRISKEEATNEFSRINFMNDAAFAMERDKWNSNLFVDSEYADFRNALIEIKSSFTNKYGITNLGGSDYANLKARFDVEIGLKLFELTNSGKYRMLLRDASDNSIWWFISLFVVPDLVYYRYNYGKEEMKEHRLNADRFYAKTRRIWLKSLWWYVFLSLQHDNNKSIDLAQTKKMIQWSTTDDILQLVDRAGLGYIPELTRSIMRQYFTNREKGNKDDELLRKVMKMNTARCKVQNPLLIGIDEYVKSLFTEFA